ncbi:MAG: type I restriction enzyme HsdR N-terminal domain-containing protein [Muribaculaceae bacterium]|nr:type I restriction enzyme HsdR N-terminal domain-containing protein [Muribaculaceae bacterium]
MEFNSKKYPPLNLPYPELKVRKDEDMIKVFDSLRGKYVALTPEEYVRQHFTAWLRNSLHYPASLMANEIGIEVNGMKKRCDTVVFSSDSSPLVIIEYKAPDVVISQSVFDQIVRYNMALKARYLIVSNGLNHYCCVIDYNTKSYNFIPAIPDYREITKTYSEN